MPMAKRAKKTNVIKLNPVLEYPLFGRPRVVVYNQNNKVHITYDAMYLTKEYLRMGSESFYNLYRIEWTPPMNMLLKAREKILEEQKRQKF